MGNGIIIIWYKGIIMHRGMALDGQENYNLDWKYEKLKLLQINGGHYDIVYYIL